METKEPVSIDDIIAENWSKFSNMRERAERALKGFSAEFPPDFYEALKEELLGFLLPKGNRTKLKVKLVIDTNIIIRDAFRVAKGKPSTTERFLSSAFVELIAPSNIIEEVHETIRKDLPRGASLEKAVRHARFLLSKVKIVASKSGAHEAAKKLIWSRVGTRSPTDVYFLGLAIESEADAVVSGDKKAFEALPTIRRWEMSETVKVVQTYEAGTLSLFLVGVGFDLSSKMFQQLLVLFLKGLEEAVQIVVALTGLLVKGSLGVLSSLPSWAWALVLGVVGVVLVLAIVNSEFRAGFSETIGKAVDEIKVMFKGLFDAVEYFWQAIRNIFIIIWNLTAPIILPNLIVATGVLCETVAGLMKQARGNFDNFTSPPESGV
jgi:predicted nucleic acid-binding protein